MYSSSPRPTAPSTNSAHKTIAAKIIATEGIIKRAASTLGDSFGGRPGEGREALLSTLTFVGVVVITSGS